MLREIRFFQDIEPRWNINLACILSIQKFKLLADWLLFSEFFKRINKCKFSSLFQHILDFSFKLLLSIIITFLRIYVILDEMFFINWSLLALKHFFKLVFEEGIMLVFYNFISKKLEIDIEGAG